MTFDQYRGKNCLIIACNQNGRIEDVISRKNQHNQLSMRFLVNRADGSQGLYEPHQITIDLSEPETLTQSGKEVVEIAETLNNENEHTRETNTGT